MSIKKSLTLLLFLSIGQILFAQESGLYRDYQTNYKRGMHFYSQKLYGQALEEFDRVIKAPNSFQDTDVPIYILQAELYAGLSALFINQPDAEKRLLYFIEKNEPSAVATRAKLAIGNYYYDQRNYDQAIAYLSDVDDLELSNEEIIEKKFKLAYCYFVRKAFDKAQVLFQQIKEAKTVYYYPSHYYYGITKFFDKEYDDALESLQIAGKSSRYEKIVPTYIIQIYFANKDYNNVIQYGKALVTDNSILEKEQVTQLVGQSYFELGEYQKALPLLENYVTKSGKVTMEELYQLGYTQYKVGKYQEAIQNFEQLNREQNKIGQNALYNMADCHLKIGNKPAARQAFQNAQKMNYVPLLQEDALVNYAKLSYELGYDNDAISSLQLIQETSSYYNEAQNLMSKVFLNTRDYAKALETLRKINQETETNKGNDQKIVLKETHQKVAYFRGLQLLNDNKYDQAITLFDESLKYPINIETKTLVYFWKGEALFKKDAYDASIDEYTKFLTTAKLTNKIVEKLPDNSSIGVGYYGLGYSYIKKGDYGNASKNFMQAVDTIERYLTSFNDKYVTNFVYPDALLRTGDCLLYLKNYKKASGYYKNIIEKGYANKDYAMYQQSVIHYLMNFPYEQIALLDKLVAEYPNSMYADDAIYAKGNAYLNMDRKELAVVSYEKLIKEYPNSENSNKALLKLGLIAYSLGRNDEAVNYYKAVFRADPESEEAKDALAAIKAVYVESGDPDGYFNFVNTVQGYEVGEMERDSLLYITAQMKYNASDLQGAVKSYTTYLERFPNGMNATQARFNRGEALFDLKRYEEAIKDYAFISDAGTGTFAETANHRAANISYYSTQNFAEAAKYYGRLEQVATTEERLFEAQQFGMRANFYASNLQALPAIAERFINNARTTPQDHAEANYFLGKAYLGLKNYPASSAAFNNNISLSGDDARSAESRYWRAYITYLNRDLDKAMDQCFLNNKEISGHPYWLVKSFILLSDIYAEKDNLFQAKATLQSIVDNYDGDQDLLNEAKRKLKLVVDAEKNKSKIKRANPDGNLEMLEEK